jgi:hypothetical protein
MVAALAAGLSLSACAGGLPSAGAPGPGGTSAATPATGGASPAAAVAQRDLSPEEKKAIVDAVAPNIKDAGSAKYHWAKFPAATAEDTTNYCATVDANSPYLPYNGRQAYIVEVRLTGGRVVGATMGLIAGGKDVAIVAKMCAKYGLDPNKAR